MVRNDDYWGEVPAFENLIFKFVVDNTARMVALETGEVDIVSEIAAEDVNRAIAGEIEHVIGYATPSYKVNFLNFNYQVPELAIKENRLAIAHAVDWEAACEAAGAGVIQPAQSCLASTVFAYQPQGIYDYDPELAKEYLAEAGNPDGFAVKATIGETATTMRMMEIIQANLADVGIALEIEIVDTPTLNEANNKGLSELTVGNMTANTADPAHTLNGTDQNSPRMSFRVTDARYNELMEEGLREMDETKRAAIYEELQQYVYENAIQIPMFEEIITYAVRDYVVGFVPGTAACRSTSRPCRSPDLPRSQMPPMLRASGAFLWICGRCGRLAGQTELECIAQPDGAAGGQFPQQVGLQLHPCQRRQPQMSRLGAQQVDVLDRAAGSLLAMGIDRGGFQLVPAGPLEKEGKGGIAVGGGQPIQKAGVAVRLPARPQPDFAPKTVVCDPNRARVPPSRSRGNSWGSRGRQWAASAERIRSRLPSGSRSWFGGSSWTVQSR